MSKVVVCVGILIGSMLASTNAEAFRWRVHRSKLWGIRFAAPKHANMRAKAHGRWAGLVGRHGGVKVAMFAYKGLATDRAVARFARGVTRIPARYWKLKSKGLRWHGFRRWATYTVRYKNRTLVAAMLRHGRRPITYLVFVDAPNRTYRRFPLSFARFAASFWAI